MLAGRNDRGSFPTLLLVTFVVLAAVASPGAANEPKGPLIVPPANLPPVVETLYEIQVGDVLDINFFKTSQLNQTRTVGPDGEIFLPLIGRVDVLGRTVSAVTDELTERYRAELINPQITVSVAQFSGMVIYISGEVNGPGLRSYRGGLTLVQAIFDAGGFTKRARQSQVLLIRPGPDQKPVGTLRNVKEIIRKGNLQDDIQLAPLDIIYVPQKKIVNVNDFVEYYINRNVPRVGAWFWGWWTPESD